MVFNVPKVVRSPGCDHGHDEESRNGRDIKIDILEPMFGKVSEYRGYRNPLQEVNGPSWALVEKREVRLGGGACPPWEFELD